nr:ATP synthase F1 subunit gamma [Pseudomonadota bacterium]
MAVGREIKTKIASIKNTQKITGAMEMVAASKMRRAQDLMELTRPYALRVRQVIGHIANSHSEYRHRYLERNDNPKRVGYIVVTSDRGLCGGLNINLLKLLLRDMKRRKEAGIESEVCTIGTKGNVFLRRIHANIVGAIRNIGDKPIITDLIGVAKVMTDRFESGEIDAVYLCYNNFINTMAQEPVIEQLLPLQMAENDSSKHYWDYIYEPDAQELLDALLVRFIESQIY